MAATGAMPAGGAMGVTVAMDAMAVAVAADVIQCLHQDVTANRVMVEKAVSVLRPTVRHGTVSREYRGQVSAMHRDVR